MDNLVFCSELVDAKSISFSAFLQEVTGDEGMAYYFGSLVLIVSGLILLPFSRAIQMKTTEIEVTVVDNSHNNYIRDEGLFEYDLVLKSIIIIPTRTKK
jgi:hypothetical protein